MDTVIKCSLPCCNVDEITLGLRVIAPSGSRICTDNSASAKAFKPARDKRTVFRFSAAEKSKVMVLSTASLISWFIVRDGRFSVAWLLEVVVLMALPPLTGTRTEVIRFERGAEGVLVVLLPCVPPPVGGVIGGGGWLLLPFWLPLPGGGWLLLPLSGG